MVLHCYVIAPETEHSLKCIKPGHVIGWREHMSWAGMNTYNPLYTEYRDWVSSAAELALTGLRQPGRCQDQRLRECRQTRPSPLQKRVLQLLVRLAQAVQELTLLVMLISLHPELPCCL